jgi:hypothetical protein
MTNQLEQEAALRQLGRTALMVFRGAREDGSLMEAFWATAALMLALAKKDDE